MKLSERISDWFESEEIARDGETEFGGTEVGYWDEEDMDGIDWDISSLPSMRYLLTAFSLLLFNATFYHSFLPLLFYHSFYQIFTAFFIASFYCSILHFSCRLK